MPNPAAANVVPVPAIKSTVRVEEKPEVVSGRRTTLEPAAVVEVDLLDKGSCRSRISPRFTFNEILVKD